MGWPRHRGPCETRVLIPGRGFLRVTTVPTGAALAVALRKAYRLEGRVVRRGGAWVFLAGGPVAPKAGGLFLGREVYDALVEQDPGWLAGVAALARWRWTGSGVWVESAGPALLGELRRRVAEAVG